MSTFFELQNEIADAKFRKTVLLHLVEHLDANFRSVGGAPPKNVLLTDEKVQVPGHIFEAIVSDLLLAEAQGLDDVILSINNTFMSQAAVPAPDATGTASPAPAQEAAQPPPAPLPFVPGMQQPFIPPQPPVLPAAAPQDTPVTRRRRQAAR